MTGRTRCQSRSARKPLVHSSPPQRRAQPSAEQDPEQREARGPHPSPGKTRERAERRPDRQHQHRMDRRAAASWKRVRHREAEAGPERSRRRDAGAARQPAARRRENDAGDQHAAEQHEPRPWVAPVRQERHVEGLAPVQSRGGEPVPVLVRREEADQQDPREHGGHRPQGQHDASGGDVERAAALTGRAHSDGDGRRVDEGQGEQVEQQGDRHPLRDEVKHRAPESEAGAEIRSLEQREAGEAMVLVEGESGRRDAVEPAQILERCRLVEAVEAVVVVLERLLRLRLQVLALDQVLGADAAWRCRHHREHHHGDPDERREHQQDSPDEVGGHRTFPPGRNMLSKSPRLDALVVDITPRPHSGMASRGAGGNCRVVIDLLGRRSAATRSA